MRVLLVRQVGPDLGGLVQLLILLALAGATAVHPDVVDKEEKGGEGAAGLGAHDSKLGGAELGGVAGLEGLRADDVAEGEGAGDEGGGKGALGAAGDVDDGPVVEDGQGRDNGVDEVDAGQDAGAVGGGQEGHEGAADDGGDDAGNDPRPAVRAVADAEPDHEGEEDADHARGHVHQGCLLGGVLEAADESGRVRGDDAAGDRQQDNRNEEKPELGIKDGLANLLEAELLGRDASLVDGDVLEKGELLDIRKPFSLHRSVGQEKDDGKTSDDGNAAEDYKHGAPSRQSGIGSNMLEAIRDSTTQNLAETETKVPKREARSLLRLCVPVAANEHEGRTNSGLKHAEEDARDEQGLVVVRGSTAGGSNTPEGDVEAEPLGSRKSLEEVDVGDLKAKQTNKEIGGNVGEVVALEVQVLGKAHDGSIVVDDFVKELQGIAAEHERDNTPINLAAEGGEVHIVDFGLVNGTDTVEELPGIVDV